MTTKMPITLLTLLLLSVSAMAGTITVSYLAYPTGTPLQQSNMFGTPAGPLSAPNTIIVNGITYNFLFWITPCDGPTTANPAPACPLPGSSTAWYNPVCSTPCPGIRMDGFSLSDNAALPGTPIAKVDPAANWVTGSNTVSMSNQITAITAKSMLDNQNFVTWLQFGGGTSNALLLTVFPNQSDLGIAFYRAPPDPSDSDPCFFYQQIEAEAFALSIKNPTPVNLASYQKAAQQYGKCLHCETVQDPVKQAQCFGGLGPLLRRPQ